jgi:ribokinase
MVRRLGDRARGWAVLTLGAAGAVASDGRKLHRVEGHRVDVVRDTTGAGDTFTGYLVAGLMAGREMPEALRFATVAAALSVTKHGAVSSIPRGEEVFLTPG